MRFVAGTTARLAYWSGIRDDPRVSTTGILRRPTLFTTRESLLALEAREAVSV